MYGSERTFLITEWRRCTISVPSDWQDILESHNSAYADAHVLQ